MKSIFIIFLSFFVFTIDIYSADSKDLTYSLKGSVNSANTELAQMYLLRAKQKQKEGDYEAANADFEKAFNFDSKLANQYKDLRFTNQAEKWIEKASNCFYDDEKITCYKKAIDMDPKCVQAYFFIGKIFYKNKNFLEAIKNFKQAFLLDPSFKKAQKMLQKSETHYKK